MNKLTVLATLSGAVLLAAVSSTAFAAAPGGFGGSNAQAAPGGVQGFAAPAAAGANTVAQVVQSSYDEQKVTLTGKLTNFIGGERYEFSDSTGSVIVKLDDDQDWSHLNKEQTITIFGEVDREHNKVEIEVDRAVVAQ